MNNERRVIVMKTTAELIYELKLEKAKEVDELVRKGLLKPMTEVALGEFISDLEIKKG